MLEGSAPKKPANARPAGGAAKGAAKKKKPGVKNEFLPASFEARGATIPFTSQPLRHARIRLDEDGVLEALVPGLSGAEGVYVIPWSGLGQVISMSVHDRMLHDNISKSTSCKPEDVRAFALELAKSGVAGVKASQSAREELELDKTVRHNIRMYLIYKLVREVAGDEACADVKSKNQIRAVDVATKYVKDYIDGIGMKGPDMHNGLLAWAEAAAPIGLAEEGHKGTLRLLSERLADFSTSMANWASNEPPETHIAGTKISKAAKAVSLCAESRFLNVEKVMVTPKAALARLEDVKKLFAYEAERAAWILDGWTRVLDEWEEGLTKERYKQRDLAIGLQTCLPIMPEDEVAQEDRALWEELQGSQIVRKLDANGEEVQD